MDKHLEWRRMDSYWELMLVDNKTGVLQDSYIAVINFGSPESARFWCPGGDPAIDVPYKTIKEAKTDIINTLTDMWCND